jgi:hypothetical protein
MSDTIRLVLERGLNTTKTTRPDTNKKRKA